MQAGCILIVRYDFVLAVCKYTLKGGIFLERYDRPSNYLPGKTRRLDLNYPTHKSPELRTTYEVSIWLLETIFPNHEGLLSDQNFEFMQELEAEVWQKERVLSEALHV